MCNVALVEKNNYLLVNYLYDGEKRYLFSLAQKPEMELFLLSVVCVSRTPNALYFSWCVIVFIFNIYKCPLYIPTHESGAWMNLTFLNSINRSRSLASRWEREFDEIIYF